MKTFRRGFVALSLTALLASASVFSLGAISATADNSESAFLPPSVESLNPHPGQIDGGQGGTGNGSGNGNGNGNGSGNAGKTGTAGSATISYHAGAPVMANDINVYIIWYGDWTGAASTAVANSTSTNQSHAGNKALIQNFLGNIGGSSHFNINTDYYQTIANVTSKITGNVKLAGQTTTFLVGNTKKTSLSDTDIKTVVTSAITANSSFQVAGKPDPNGVYFVFTSAGIAESSGFLSKYCGWHSAATINTVTTKYSFVGDPAKSIASCAGQVANSPHSSLNNNLTAGDAMVSVIVHELEETATDPQLNAWYDSSGYENGDKCAWTFGTATAISTGFIAPGATTETAAKFNYAMGGSNWLLQQNWQIASSPQSCAISK